MLLTTRKILESPLAYGGKETKIAIVNDDVRMVFDRLPLQTRLGDNKCSPIRTNTGWLMYVGEIFNYDKSEYDSDVDFLAGAFNSIKPENIARISKWWDGFWAICYYDETTDNIYCWTDPLGKKQLYFRLNPGTGFPEICSEIKPLVRDFSKFDRFYQSEVFKWGYNMDDRTPWIGVKRILPNMLYRFTAKGDYTVLRDPILNWDEPLEGRRSLFDLLLGAVNDRLITTGSRIGVMLSGGLDSSIIAALLRHLDADIDLYTINNGSDYAFAHLMADHLGMPITDLEYEMNDQQFVESCFRTNETPIDLGSVVPNQAMFKNIPADIVLSGDGADELFGGYRRIDDYDSQLSDVFQELSFYHLPRLDRACSRYTKELRNPFLAHDVIRYALQVPYWQRQHKGILKTTFGFMLPEVIKNRAKLPLKNDELRKDPIAYRKQIHAMFYNPNFWSDYENS